MFLWLTRNGATPGISPFCRVPCSPHLEHLSIICRPFYLPREFLLGHRYLPFYIPPQADTSFGFVQTPRRAQRLHQQTPWRCLYHSGGPLTKPPQGRVMPNFHQHVSCPNQRTEYTGSLLHSVLRMPTKLVPCQPSVSLITPAIFLTPEYKQRIVQESPGVREDDALVLPLWSYATGVSWWRRLDMFRASSADVSEFTDVALSFVYMLTDQATETVTIRTFSNQKPWVDRTIRAAVNQRTAAYKRWSSVMKHERLQSIVLYSPTGS